MIKLDRPNCPNRSALSWWNYKHTDNKNALKEASFHKCMYCESKTSHVYYWDIEHIKPKSKFPELEFDWNNLGYVCAKCNWNKSDKFDETTPFVNPYDDNPEDYIIFNWAFTFTKQWNERWDITIKDIDLNRVELLEKRQERIDSIDKAIKSCFRTNSKTLKETALQDLIKEIESEKEYSLCIKYLLKAQEII